MRIHAIRRDRRAWLGLRHWVATGDYPVSSAWQNLAYEPGASHDAYKDRLGPDGANPHASGRLNTELGAHVLAEFAGK